MFLTFLGFFFRYIFKAKTRQGLLLMAMLGLTLSSFSLLVVQSALKGLQNNRINRSKEIQGHYVINATDSIVNSSVTDYLKEHKILFSREYLLEAVLRKGAHIAPVIIHGLDDSTYTPTFLGSDLSRGEILMSYNLANKVLSNLGDELQIISPVHTDAFFGDLPRSKLVNINRYINTNEPDVDEVHAWVHIKVLQSLAKKKTFNRFRIYQKLSKTELGALSELTDTLFSWEKMNSTLVYALTLENNVILFLFMATVVLVVFTIASGLSIFYARVKQDFAAFWIMGMSIKSIKRMGVINISLITIMSLILGNLLALLFLYALEAYSPVIMPEMFVDRSLPILITKESFIFSLLLPSVVTLLFTYFSNVRFFSDKKDFLQLIRSVGR